MKTLHYSDAGSDCKAVVQANTEEQVLRQAAVNAQEVYGVELSSTNCVLTPSFKIKRNQIEKKYSSRYEEWHDQKGMVVR